MDIAFTSFIKSKGYNKRRLAEACDIPAPVISNRINERSPWEWSEVGKVCEVLDITYDDFASFFPAGNVRPSPREPTREERIDNVLAELRAILV